MEDRLVGDGEPSLCPNSPFSELNRFSVAGSRPCQKRRGEELPSEALKGDDWNGDESRLGTIFCRTLSVVNSSYAQKRSTYSCNLIETRGVSSLFRRSQLSERS